MDRHGGGRLTASHYLRQRRQFVAGTFQCQREGHRSSACNGRGQGSPDTPVNDREHSVGSERWRAGRRAGVLGQQFLAGSNGARSQSSLAQRASRLDCVDLCTHRFFAHSTDLWHDSRMARQRCKSVTRTRAEYACLFWCGQPVQTRKVSGRASGGHLAGAGDWRRTIGAHACESQKLLSGVQPGERIAVFGGPDDHRLQRCRSALRAAAQPCSSASRGSLGIPIGQRTDEHEPERNQRQGPGLGSSAR